MRFWLLRSPEGDGGGGIAAPAAPAPDAPPAATPLQQAVEDARARIAAAEAAPVAAGEPDNRPRNPDGTFAPQTPPEGAPAEAPTGDAPNPLVVEVPGRRPEDPPDVYEAATPEQADRLRQLVNGYMRADAVRQQEFRVRADQQHLNEISTMMQYDPEGFLFENIPPERAASVALQVLLQPEVWGQVNDALAELLASDEKRELVRVSLENARFKNRDAVHQAMETQRASAQNANLIKQAIAVMIPPTLPEAQQVALYQACQADIIEHANRLRLDVMDPRDVPLVIAARLRAGGVDPVQAASVFTRQAGNGQASGQAPRIVARPPAAAPSGKDLVAAHAAARAAATIAPAGAGAPSAASTGQPPANQSLEERIAWGRKNLKFTTG